jgi:hypothetical protein
MTVRELIKKLQDTRRPDAMVYLSRDGEGNGFRSLQNLSVERFDEHNERQEGGTNSVCLWPVY